MSRDPRPRRFPATSPPATGFTPEDFARLDPSDFLIVLPGKTVQAVAARVDAETLAIVDTVAQDKRLPFEESRSKLVLWCLIRGLEHLAQVLGDKDIQDALLVMHVSLARTRTQLMARRMGSFLDETLSALRQFLDRGEFVAARALISRTEDGIMAGHNDDLKTMWRERAEKMRDLTHQMEMAWEIRERNAEDREQAARILESLGIGTKNGEGE